MFHVRRAIASKALRSEHRDALGRTHEQRSRPAMRPGADDYGTLTAPSSVTSRPRTSSR
jgi:hypothetical protein